jgi:uncharacterized protein YcnI
MPDDAVLPDGSYDAFIIDATREGDTLHVELTIIAGDHKGDVVSVAAEGVERDELDLMGVPATIVVDGGTPVVSFEE